MSVGRLVSTIGFVWVFPSPSSRAGARRRTTDARERAVLRDFNAAAALQNAGLYDRAGEKWTAFISQNPGDTRLDRAYYYLGICPASHQEVRRGDRIPSRRLPSKYPAFPNGEGVQYSLGMARYQAALESKNRDDFQLAAETLAAAAAKYPQGKHTAAALYYQGEALLAAGDPAAAMEAYKKLIAQLSHQPAAGRGLLRPGNDAARGGPRFRGDRDLPEVPRHRGRWPATSWPRRCGCGWGYRS